VGVGLAACIARPGGNVTGLSIMQPDLPGKRFELLREVKRKRVLRFCLSEITVVISRLRLCERVRLIGGCVVRDCQG
jgi:hypothetical protein